MFSHQARINARTIRRDRLTPTAAAAWKLAGELAMFLIIATAVGLLADGYLRLASGDLQTIHAQAAALRGW